MDPGGILEAPFDLQESIPAGNYRLVLDAYIAQDVLNMRIDLVHRREGVDLPVITPIEETYTILPGNDPDDKKAQRYSYDRAGIAVDFMPGDKLVLVYTAIDATTPMAYIPNGDGPDWEGEIPHIDLP